MSTHNKAQYTFAIPKALKHLKLVFTHRFFVCKYCFKVGLYRQGLTHDLSKFTPVEFIESVRYYTGTRSPIDTAKELTGYSAAWLHHKGHNRHHYEYWVDGLDQGGIPAKMPFRFALEMVCDYIAAGKIYNGADWTLETPLLFWQKKRVHAKIHPDTAAFMDHVFGEIAVQGLEILPRLASLQAAYETGEFCVVGK